MQTLIDYQPAPARQTSHSPRQPACTDPVTCECCQGTRQNTVRTVRFGDSALPYRFRRCLNCGLVFCHPRPADDAVHDLYGNDYYLFHIPPARRWARATQLYINTLLPMEKPGGSGRLLDVGCSLGDVLAIAQHRGWQVEGIEMAESAARTARDTHALCVHVGTIEQHAGRIGRFDVVLATDVIEHVPSPRSFVSAIRAVLNPNGCAVIETPNWASSWRRWGGSSWIGFNPYHICFFDERSLAALMRSCGFCRTRTACSTHTAHVNLGSRPEITRWTRRLPTRLGWRAERFLNRLTPNSLGRHLNDNPPTSIEESLRWVEQLKQREPWMEPPSDPGSDNLTLFAWL